MTIVSTFRKGNYLQYMSIQNLWLLDFLASRPIIGKHWFKSGLILFFIIFIRVNCRDEQLISDSVQSAKVLINLKYFVKTSNFFLILCSIWIISSYETNVNILKKIFVGYYQSFPECSKGLASPQVDCPVTIIIIEFS